MQLHLKMACQVDGVHGKAVTASVCSQRTAGAVGQEEVMELELDLGTMELDVFGKGGGGMAWMWCGERKEGFSNSLALQLGVDEVGDSSLRSRAGAATPAAECHSNEMAEQPGVRQKRGWQQEGVHQMALHRGIC